MPNPLKSLLPGTEVHARGLRWEIVGMLQQGDQTLVRLRGIEGVVNGQEMDFLYPLENIQPVQRELNPDQAVPLQKWLVYHQAFLLEQALGSNALLSVQPGRLRIEPYQLVPVMRAIKMRRVRLLLADGVGLGKTIETGLVLTELIARRLAHRILIVSPAGPLMEQWQVEMRERFGLRLQVINRAFLEEIRRSTELGSNPFDHVPVGIVSIDFLKQDRILDLLDRASYDVTVIDEAHHCMDVGAGNDRDSSQRRKLATIIARNCDSLLLLTATPHDGSDRSFASLCELLDPSLVNGRGTLRGEQYRANVVRRLKKHIFTTDTETGEREPMFPDRIVTPVPVVPIESAHGDFMEMQRQLLDLVAPELRRASRTRNYSDVLAWIALLKRSVSSVYACGRTIEVVAERYQDFLTDTADLQKQRRERISALKEYEKRSVRYGSVSAEEEESRADLEAEDIAQQLAEMQREIRRGSYKQTKISDVVLHLDELVELAQKAKHTDPKIDALAKTIEEMRADEPDANILIYTEYVDSQNAIHDGLKEKGVGVLITMNGNDDEKTRSQITERFRTTAGLVLISTDSASEGLNLHKRCHHLIHFELPFNPNRLEQRNGRIDRYGQKLSPEVRYLYLKGTFEERILLRLIAKYERQRARLTFVPNTLGVTTDIDASNDRLLQGIMNEDEKLFDSQTTMFDLVKDDPEKGADEATQELLREIDRSLSGFDKASKTNDWLGDAGLNANEQQMEEAGNAHRTGVQNVDVPLAQFVCDAVRLDGDRMDGRIEDDVFTLHLTRQWIHGLDEIEGYDADKHIVRLTTKLDVTFDDDNHSVGYLGRAHPLVRRALDRVRNVSFGGTDKGQDQRVSVVKADINMPQIIYTYLGRVSSNLGREYERVFAVRITKSGTMDIMLDTEEWLQFAKQNNAISTREVWEKHFKSWAEQVEAKVIEEAKRGFHPIAEDFMNSMHREFENEKEDLNKWLKTRSDDITGSAIEAIKQEGMFDTSPEAISSSSWAQLSGPQERLASFHTDRDQTPSARMEAEGVLRLYNQRMKDLEDRSHFADHEIIPLGMLMIVPEDV